MNPASPSAARVLVCADHGVSGLEFLPQWAEVVVAADGELPEQATLAHLANFASRHRPRADVVLVFGGVRATPGWIESLRQAIDADTTAASASALGSAQLAGIRRGIIEGPPLATAPSDAMAALSPRLPAPLPTCVWLRRAALDLTGPLDESLRSSEGALIDFGLKARAAGLSNLAAADLVLESGAGELDEQDARELRSRHVAAETLLQAPPTRAVERAASLATLRTRRLAVTFDARALSTGVGGTQVYMLELLRALADTGHVALRVLTAPELPSEVAGEIRSLPNTAILEYDDALGDPGRTDVVHRPQQVFTPDDLLLLRKLGRRVVVTHHDLIAYHNPSYFADIGSWQQYARTTAAALSAVDHVLFFSNHARTDALREDLVEPWRTAVAELAADRAGTGAELAAGLHADCPAGLPPLEPGAFILCLGADYRHKNRPFAIALTDELAKRGWRGSLVLAGPHAAHGSSAEDESRVEREREISPDLVHRLPALSAEQRAWLTAGAAAIAYPTVDEGFGLVPFDAAAAGVPCLFAEQSALAELLPAELATLSPWDATESARRVAPLLAPGPERDAHLAGLRGASERRTWFDCALATIDAYRHAVAAPYRDVALAAWQALEREAEIVRLDELSRALEDRLKELEEGLGPDAIGLVAPPHPLLSRTEQRALLSVATRPAAKRALFGALVAIYRSTRRVQRSDG